MFKDRLKLLKIERKLNRAVIKIGFRNECSELCFKNDKYNLFAINRGTRLTEEALRPHINLRFSRGVKRNVQSFKPKPTSQARNQRRKIFPEANLNSTPEKP